MRQLVKAMYDARLAACLVVTLGQACADTPVSDSREAAAASHAVTTPTAVPLDGGIVADVEVWGSSGRRRYHVETMQGTCSRRTSDAGSWVVQLASRAAPRWAAELRIPNAAAAGQGTVVFAFIVAFDSAGVSVAHEVDGTGARASSPGGGRVTVLDSGVSATIVVEGLTRDGVRLSAVIRCRHVTRFPGPDAG